MRDAKLSAVVIFACLLALTLPAQTGPVPSPSGITAWWPGDGDAKNVVGDDPLLDGVLTNGARADAPGLVGQAFAFNGASSYVRLPNLIPAQPEGTVECWFKLNTWDWNVTPSGRFLWSSTLYSPDSGVSFDGINLGCHIEATTTGELMFGLWDTVDAPGWHWALSGVTPQTNVWYHIAGTWGSNGIRIYINGALRGTAPYTGPAPGYLQYNVLGSSSWPNTFMDGVIDEFSIYNRALEAWEIAAIHTAGSAGKLRLGTRRYVNVNNPTPVAPYTNWATAATVIQDAVDIALPGDEIVVTNGVYETGGRVVAGTLTNRVAVTKLLTLRSVNGPEVTVIRGRRRPEVSGDLEVVRCVYLMSGAVLSGFTLMGGGALPYGSGALYVDDSGGGVRCESTSAVVANCVLGDNEAAFGGGAFSGTLQDCILTNNQAGWGGGGSSSGILNDCILTRNSAEYGGGADNSELNNCTVVSNWAGCGGGVSVCELSNCKLIGNLAIRCCAADRGYGGGAYASRLHNCIVAGNAADLHGGGVYGNRFYPSFLTNCTVTGNSAIYQGGGVFADGGTIYNSIVYYNTAPHGSNYSQPFGFTGLSYCCTTPLPLLSVGNITNAPLFIDEANRNFRLQSNSPCINAGWNADVTTDVDLDGNPRIIGGTVDIGAYEFQSPQSTLSYAWLQQYGLPTDGSSDSLDFDGDGHNNWQEWRAWTAPTNPTSVLRLVSPRASTNGVIVEWQSVSGQIYFLERSTNIGSGLSFIPIAHTIIGQPGSTAIVDTNATGAGPLFYRVSVQE